jgi:glutaminyl-tRNA synthetase
LTEENVIEAAIKQNCEFTKFVNPESLVERRNAKVWNMHKDAKIYDRFQFERVGYFCVD